MKYTMHMEKRMTQRNINNTMIYLARMFGETSHSSDKIVLNKKTLLDLRKTIENLISRNGLTLIEDKNVLITSYFNDKWIFI